MKETVKLIFDEAKAQSIAHAITMWLTKKLGPITKDLKFNEITVTPEGDDDLVIHVDVKATVKFSKIFSLVLKKMGL